DQAPELGRSERNRAPVLAQDPGGELPEVGVVRDEDVVLDLPEAPVEAVDPPRCVAADLNPGLPLRLADLPGRALAVLVRVEAFRQAEVPLAACGQPDVAADPGHAER